jgi:hypothetical protein
MSRHTTHRRLAPNDVVYRTASGGVLIAAGPTAANGPPGAPGPSGGGLAQRVARLLASLR